jgi:homoserine kinase
MFLSTRSARSILKREVGMSDFVWQTANLAGFIAGCFTGDIELIREGLNDVVIEPQRRKLIPGGTAVRDAAIEAGAIGCSISGAGPSLFAWAAAETAETVRRAMIEAFARNGVEVDHWVVDMNSQGARVVD